MSNAKQYKHLVKERHLDRRSRILVVDDCPSVLFMLRSTLERMDFEVETAAEL